jgi:hypothetical protein
MMWRDRQSPSMRRVASTNHNGEALTEFLKSGGWPSLAIRRRKERLNLSAANTEGPRERARHHWGLALALSGSAGG